MKIILCEDIKKLGRFGEKVNVANGYARNFLLPQGKAVPAMGYYLEEFEQRRESLEQAASERLSAAQSRATALNDIAVTIAAQASEEGKLYGSVGAIEIMRAYKEQGVALTKSEIRLPKGPVREVGEFEIDAHLYSDVNAVLKVTVVAEK